MSQKRGYACPHEEKATAKVMFIYARGSWLLPLKEMEMRKCTAKTCRKSAIDGKWETIDILGVFHQFAPQYDEFESGPGNSTIAIVEDIEGQVWQCSVDTVKFLSPNNYDRLKSQNAELLAACKEAKEYIEMENVSIAPIIRKKAINALTLINTAIASTESK